MIRAALISTLLVVSAQAGVDVERLVDALREREGYRGKPGALGEQGPWQLMPSTWAMHMPGRPISEARDAVQARVCALRHVRWLQAELARRCVDASVFNLAAAWNAGLASYVSGRAPVRAYRFAADVVAIYSSGVVRHRHDLQEHALRLRRLEEAHQLSVSLVDLQRERDVQAPIARPELTDRPSTLGLFVNRRQGDARFLPREFFEVGADHVAPPIDGEDAVVLNRELVGLGKIDHRANERAARAESTVQPEES
jgi:hypothetical protein